ncbi:sensor histidine kinase [Hungatella sp. SB206]|uniref:sensor histidine kinase n=1 Tax=Hungatella sp. SB206 TaxID=2937758 RepID=UPI003DA89865
MRKNSLLKSIRGKITFFTAALTITLTVLAVTICFYAFHSYQKKMMIRSSEFNLQSIADNTSADLNNILSFVKWCCSSSDVAKYMDTIHGQGTLGQISSKNPRVAQMAFDTYDRIWEEYTLHNQSNYIRRLILSSDNPLAYMQMFYSSVPDRADAASLIASQDFFIPLYEASSFQWDGMVQNPFNRISDEFIIPVVRPIYSGESSQTTGWLYVEISPELITSRLKAYPLESDSLLYLTIGEKNYLCDKGTLTESPFEYQQVSDLKGSTISTSSKAMEAILPGLGKRTILTCSLGIPDFQLTEVLSVRRDRAQQTLYTCIIAGILFAALSFGVVLMYFLNRTIVKPVHQLRQNMDSISRGIFDKNPDIEWENELGEIGKGINDLSENVVNLMNTRIKQERQKKDLEYQILQSQINPHFLYNTLNSVKWMATIQGATGIADMMTVLARLLKNVSKRSESMITLKEELELAGDYFQIQQYRYGSSISIRYEIASEDLFGCMVHRFSLQPLIENALFHGLEPKRAPGTITVFASSEGSGETKVLVLSVTDDGIGMSQETIEKVMSGESLEGSDFFKHIGISNVNNRIKYDFGASYGITITSEPGVYTTMTIRIPYIHKKEGVEKQA